MRSIFGVVAGRSSAGKTGRRPRPRASRDPAAKERAAWIGLSSYLLSRAGAAPGAAACGQTGLRLPSHSKKEWRHRQRAGRGGAAVGRSALARARFCLDRSCCVKEEVAERREAERRRDETRPCDCCNKKKREREKNTYSRFRFLCGGCVCRALADSARFQKPRRGERGGNQNSKKGNRRWRCMSRAYGGSGGGGRGGTGEVAGVAGECGGREETKKGTRRKRARERGPAWRPPPLQKRPRAEHMA